MKILDFIKNYKVQTVAILLLFVWAIYLVNQESEPEAELGSSLPIAGTTYNLAGSGVSSSATSIVLKSLTIPQTGQLITDSDVSDTFFITIEPGNRTRQEIVSCTTITQGGTSATLSGCSRGLAPISPYTASTTLQFSHSGGAQVIFSDPPQLFNDFTAQDNTEIIRGDWTFDRHPEATSALATPSTTYQYTTKEYVDNTVNQGAATSTESIGGISELATQIEMASSTDSGANKPLVLQAKYATSTPSALRGLYVVVAENDGYLAQGWLDLTEAYTWTGAHTWNTGALIMNNGYMSTASTTHTASTTFVGNTYIQTTPTEGQHAVNKTYVDSRDILFEYVNETSAMASTETGTHGTSTITGGTLGVNDVVRVTYFLHAISPGGGTDNAVFNVRYGTTDLCTLSISNITTGTKFGKLEAYIVNNNSVSSQVGNCFVQFAELDGTASEAIMEYAAVSGAVDTSSDVDLNLEVDLEADSTTLSVDDAIVEILHKR